MNYARVLCFVSWWRHQKETFSALLTICAGNSPIPGEFPTQRPVTRSFNVFFDLRPNKRLSKLWWGWWFETPSGLLCIVWYSVYRIDSNDNAELTEVEWRIYASVAYANIVSDIGLPLERQQAIIWTNAGMLLIGNKIQWNINPNFYIPRKYIWSCRLENGGHFPSAPMC